LQGFTGIGNDYEAPEAAELIIDTSSRPVTQGVEEVERMLASTGVLFDELADLAANI
jgi:bifunctional enzyme CysN/CysC